MGLFRRDPFDDWLHDLQVRLARAERVWNSTYRVELFRHVDDITEAFADCRHDLESFEDEFGEPLPDHLRAVLTIEEHIWSDLARIVHGPAPGEREYEGLCKSLQSYTEVLIEAIQVQDDIMKTCLTTRYHAVIKSLRHRAARARPRLA